MATNTTSIDWETLAEVIAEGKCVLFLGPEATINFSDSERQSIFFNQLLNDYPNDLHSYHQEDGLLVFNKKEAIYNITIKVRKFFENDYSSPMLEKLAQIPFHFIVSLTPDRTLQKEMEKQGFVYNEDYYSEIAEHAPNLPSSNTPPLIYHLLGIAKDSETIIISHEKMYNFIKSFLGGTKIPQNIKTAVNFQHAKNLIFLGVNFDKWYFQLLLNMLGVDASSYNCFASIQGGASGLRTIWEKHFKIHFVPHQIDEFVDLLHNVFSTNNQLRKVLPDALVPKKYYYKNFTNYFLEIAADEFDNFFLEEFAQVHNDFTTGQTKMARINKLLEHVRQYEKHALLINLMEKKNEWQFKKNAPYYE